jgi:hypothetical protein
MRLLIYGCANIYECANICVCKYTYVHVWACAFKNCLAVFLSYDTIKQNFNY